MSTAVTVLGIGNVPVVVPPKAPCAERGVEQREDQGQAVAESSFHLDLWSVAKQPVCPFWTHAVGHAALLEWPAELAMT